MTLITQKTAFYVGHIEQLPRHFCFESQGCFVFGNDRGTAPCKQGCTTDGGTPPELKVYYTVALTSFSGSVSCMTFLFSECLLYRVSQNNVSLFDEA